MPMLEVAEDKFYDELKLGEKHPETRVTFCIADGHCITAGGGAGPLVTHAGVGVWNVRVWGAGAGAGLMEQRHWVRRWVGCNFHTGCSEFCTNIAASIC